MTIYEKYGLRKLINARGPATVLGAARVDKNVREDIDKILAMPVEMWELQRKASEKISLLTGAQAGCVVGCAAAGIAIAVAATLTGDDVGKTKELPIIKGTKNKVVIQKGHMTGAGDAPISQVIKMTGANLIEVGEALDCAKFHLESALDEAIAAAIFVALGNIFPPNLMHIKTFIKICKDKKVPVIVDAAGEKDFKYYTDMGADITIFSAQKWLGGATAGIIAGRKDLVHACFLQELGIGRPMKVGKEGVMGVISAIDEWMKRDNNAIIKKQSIAAKNLKDNLDSIEGVSCQILNNSRSPSICLEVDINSQITNISAWEIVKNLGKSDPVIKMNHYNADLGKLVFDFSYLDEGDEIMIANKMLSLFKNVKKYYKKYSDKPNFICREEISTRQDDLYDIMKKWLDKNPRK